MTKILNSIWDFLIEMGEARQKQLRKNNYKGWY
jgi:hypothetical protein